MRIMIVDDEPASAEYIAAILMRYAAQSTVCAVAENGKDALGQIDSARPDVVITDVAMPNMDGLMLCERLREQYPSIYTIIISGYQEFEYARTAFRHGVTDYLLKPVNVQELLKCLENIARNTQSGGSADDTAPDASQAPRPIAADPLFLSLEQYVLKHLHEQITLSTLCRHCGVSQTTANRVFRKATGMSFLEFLTNQRINRARKLLDNDPGLMVKEVAARCGFSDPLYFSKVFKTYTGRSPSEYARRSDDAGDI